MRRSVLLIACACLFSSITYAQKAGVTGPHLIIYKTKGKYNKLVPVTLSGDKTKVVNYPAPSDLRAAGSKAYPTKLHKGFLMDNRGISENTGFLNLTYTAYAALKEVPSISFLQKNIRYKSPFLIVCDCGPRQAYKNPEAEVNKMIDNGTLIKKCKAKFGE